MSNSVDTKLKRPSRYVSESEIGETSRVRFHYRNADEDLIVVKSTQMDTTSEFLEHLNIIKYPPPLYYCSWKLLNAYERKTALKELQEFDREKAHSKFEEESGNYSHFPKKLLQRR